MSSWFGVWIAGAGPWQTWFRRYKNSSISEVGFVSLAEALDLPTPACLAIAGVLSVFAEFEREILRERVCAGLAHARQQRKRLGRPPSVVHQAVQPRKLHQQASR